jgi:hypothetical protein
MRPAPRGRDTASMLKIILALHITGGAAALLSMLIPIVTKKGGSAHRRAGWIFVAGMAVVSATAFVLSAARFLFDPRPAAQAAGLFLFYIAILTAAGVSAGMRALRNKRRTGPHTHVWDVGLAGLLATTGVAMAVYGIVMHMPLFVAFSALGIVNGVGQLRYWLRPPTSHMHWWYEHMSGMLGSCIAAVTAFLVNNAGHLGLSTFSLAVWLGPGLIGGPATSLWIAYYRRRFEPARKAARIRSSVATAS